MDESSLESFGPVEDGLSELRIKAEDAKRRVEDFDVEAFIDNSSGGIRDLRIEVGTPLIAPDLIVSYPPRYVAHILQPSLNEINGMAQDASSTVANVKKMATLPAGDYADRIVRMLNKVPNVMLHNLLLMPGPQAYTPP